jgi:deoxyhypusine synthase
MSTAELGLSLAEMIRQDKVHGICTTGANLEEDIFNLVAHNHYKRVPNYRNLSDAEEVALRDRGMNRVTDTCIPEEEAMRRIERQVLKLWQKADKEKQRYFPYEYMYQLIRGGLHQGILPDRSEGLLGDRGLRKESADFHARAGKIRRSEIFLWPMWCAATCPRFKS